MAIIVIGGHSRSVGKTSVVAGLISALPEFDWTAVKITQYGHGVCSANGEACDCATADHSWAISEERDRSGESDTSRFLVAGAAQALWVRTEQGRLAEAMPALRQRLRKRAQRDHRVQQRVEVSKAGPVPDRARSLDRGFQEFSPRISGPRQRCSLARGARQPGVAIRFPEAGSRAPSIPHHPAALRDSRDCRVRPLQPFGTKLRRTETKLFEARSLAARS